MLQLLWAKTCQYKTWKTNLSLQEVNESTSISLSLQRLMLTSIYIFKKHTLGKSLLFVNGKWAIQSDEILDESSTLRSFSLWWRPFWRKIRQESNQKQSYLQIKFQFIAYGPVINWCACRNGLSFFDLQLLLIKVFSLQTIPLALFETFT